MRALRDFFCDCSDDRQHPCPPSSLGHDSTKVSECLCNVTEVHFEVVHSNIVSDPHWCRECSQNYFKNTVCKTPCLACTRCLPASDSDWTWIVCDVKYDALCDACTVCHDPAAAAYTPAEEGPAWAARSSPTLAMEIVPKLCARGESSPRAHSNPSISAPRARCGQSGGVGADREFCTFCQAPRPLGHSVGQGVAFATTLLLLPLQSPSACAKRLTRQTHTDAKKGSRSPEASATVTSG